MSVAPSPASVGSCADALVVASSAIASTVLRYTCDASGASRCVGHHEGGTRSANDRQSCATVTYLRRYTAVVSGINECGDEGDAMGGSRV